MERTQQSIKRFKDNVKSSVDGINVALAGLGVGVGIGAAVNEAMKFEASVQQLNRLMGESSAEFMKWADTTAVAFNMSKSEAVQYGATFSNIISTFSNGAKETQMYTQDLLQATAVAASMTGRSMDDALERVRSGMLGNTEAIEDLGIFVNVAMIESTKAFQQFANGKSWDQIDFRTQQTIRYFAILEQAAQKYGVEVGSNSISATAKFVAQLNNLKLAIGQAFLPIWTAVLPGLTALVGWMTKGMNVVAQFMTALFGKSPVKNAQSQASANTEVAKSVGGIGDAYKKAGKEAKKAQGSVAGFDEVNTLGKSSGEGSEAETGGTSPTVDGGVATPIDIDHGIGDKATAIGEKIRGVAESIKGFFKGIGSFVTEHKDIIIAALGGIGAGLLTYAIATKGAGTASLIFGGIVKVMSGLLKGLRAAMMFLLSPIGLIVAAVALLVAGFIYFYRTNDKFRDFVNGILVKIKDAAVALWKNALVPLGEYLGGAFKTAWEGIKVAATWLWKNVFLPFGEFLKTFYKTALVPLGNVLKDVLIAYLKILIEVGKSFWKNVMVPLGDFLKASFKPTVEAISAVLKYLWEVVIKPFGVYLGKVFIDIFKLLAITIGALYNNVLKPLAPFVMNVLDKAFQTVGATIGNLKTAFNGLMKFITGVFTGDWEKAWEGVKEVFKGVFGQLYNIVKHPLNLIIDAVNKVIGGLNKISIDIPDIPGVPGGGKKIGINIPRIPKLARGGIVNTATDYGNFVAGESGTELVMPLENTGFVEKVAYSLGKAVENVLGKNQGNGGDTVIMVGETEIARVVAKGINKIARIDGKMPLNI
jgi:phage-related protein